MAGQAYMVSKRMDAAINKLVRQLILEVHHELVTNTPIDTGWARSNWIPSVGTPSELPVGMKSQIDTGGMAAGAAAIMSYDLFKEPAFITNNVPYINDLNAGWSRQAPPGYVEMAIEAGINAVDGMVMS